MQKFEIKKFRAMNTIKAPTKNAPNQATDMRDMVAKAGLLRTRDGFLKYNTTSYGNPITGLYDYTPRYTVANWLPAYPTLRAISGTPTGTPITNATELQTMNDDLAGNYYLANAIAASATTGWNGGAGFLPIGTQANKFTGIFDDNGYTISDLFINRPTTDYVGLFGFTNGAEIKNVGLIDVNITGKNRTGALIGQAYNYTTINKCYSTGSVNGESSTSGLIGAIDSYITINDCLSTVVVSGTSNVGGLVGYSFFNNTIATSYSIGAVSGTSNVGGFLGNDDGGGTYNDNFWDTQTSGQATSDGATGKTTEEMYLQSIYTNWDFSTIWEIV